MENELENFEHTINKITAAVKATSTQFENFVEYLNFMKTHFSGANDTIKELASDNEKGMHTLSDGFQGIPSVFTAAWNRMMDAFMLSKAFGDLVTCLNKMVLPAAVRTRDEYSKRGFDIIVSMQKALKLVKSCTTTAKEAHEIYKAAGTALVQTYSKSKVRDEVGISTFSDLQGKAVAAHNKMNQARRNLVTEMDRQITAFEKLELDKEQYVSEICRVMNIMTGHFARCVCGNANEIVMALSDFDEGSDVRSLRAMCQTQDAAADKNLQFIPVAPQASAILSAKGMFGEYDASVNKYYQAVEDHKGTGNELTAKHNEVFGYLDETPTHIKCCSINGTVGYLPKSKLAEYKLKFEKL